MSVETLRMVPHPDTLSSVQKDLGHFGVEQEMLSPREKEVLWLTARGLHRKEIGQQLSMSTRTVGAHIYNIFGKLGVNSREKAVILGINQGIIDLKQASSGFNIGLVNKLGGRPKEVIKEMAGGLSRKEVVDKLRISKSTLRSHLSEVFRKLNVRNDIQAVVIYIAAERHIPYEEIKAIPPVSSDLTPREKEVLRFLGTEVDKAVANRMGFSISTLRSHERAIYEKLGVSSRGQAALWGIESGIVDVEERIKGFDISKTNNLTAKEREVMENLIKSGFDHEKAASLSKIGYGTLKMYVLHIMRKLNAKTVIQAGLVFMAWQKHPEIKDIRNKEELTIADIDREIIKLLAVGASFREIVSELHYSASTIKRHVANLKKKLSVRTLAGVVITAIGKELIDVDFPSVGLSLDLVKNLTHRQKEILETLIELKGGTDKEIASKLQILPSTICKHMVNIRSILGVSNRIQATAMLVTAKKKGLM